MTVAAVDVASALAARSSGVPFFDLRGRRAMTPGENLACRHLGVDQYCLCRLVELRVLEVKK
jgi:hypothetical protein